jgi:hypothetical protein
MRANWKCLCLAASIAAIVVSAKNFTAAGPVEDQMSATCRITSQGGCGSGCTFEVDHDWVWILTAAHVVEKTSAVNCEFWRDGYQSAMLRGQVYVCDPAIDAAIVVVPVRAFGGVLPKAIPIAEASQAPRPGQTVFAVGCAKGSWATGFQGHVTRCGGGQMFFVPPPAEGRSGSAVVNAEGRIVGIVRIRTGDNREGGAVDVATLRARMGAACKTAAERFCPLDEVLTQCPGGRCPNGACPSGDGPAAPLYGVPRNENPWPNLPRRSPQMVPIHDADETSGKPQSSLPWRREIEKKEAANGESLKHIDSTLRDLAARPSAPASDGTAQEALRVANDVSRKIDDLQKSLADQKQAQGQKPAEEKEQAGQRRLLTGDLAADVENLKERLAARREEAKEKADALLESPSARHVAVTLVVLFIGALAVWIAISQHRKAGTKTLVESAADKLALMTAGTPLGQATAIFDKGIGHFGQQLRDLDAKIEGRFSAVQGQITKVSAAVPAPVQTAPPAPVVGFAPPAPRPVQPPPAAATP